MQIPFGIFISSLHVYAITDLKALIWRQYLHILFLFDIFDIAIVGWERGPWLDAEVICLRFCHMPKAYVFEIFKIDSYRARAFRRAKRYAL